MFWVKKSGNPCRAVKVIWAFLTNKTMAAYGILQFFVILFKIIEITLFSKISQKFVILPEYHL